MRRALLLCSIIIGSYWALPGYAGDASSQERDATEGAATGRDANERANHADGDEVLVGAKVHPTVEYMSRLRSARASGGSSTVSQLTYRGGTGGVGVETTPKVYLVLWGSQWNNNDPAGEAEILKNFFYGVGSSGWLASVTQYCQGVSRGTTYCNGSGKAAGGSLAFADAQIWRDDAAAAPSKPTQSQLAAEAVKAAAHWFNTTSASNASVQYVIATAHGYNSSGFGTQYCAWHSSTSSSYGNIAYTNLPYITDAGASCGANFNGLGSKAGITIIEGHELGETITDQFPSSGWIDSGGAENGDKCAWISSGQGAIQSVSLGNGLSYPVQSLWSNAFNNGAGGCVTKYP